MENTHKIVIKKKAVNSKSEHHENETDKIVLNL